MTRARLTQMRCLGALGWWPHIPPRSPHRTTHCASNPSRGSPKRDSYTSFIVKIFVLFNGKKTHQIRRHVTDEIVAVNIGELSSAGPRFNKSGCGSPCTPTLRIILDDTWASCFNSQTSHTRIRREQYVRLTSTRCQINEDTLRLTSTRRVEVRGYAIILYLQLMLFSYSPQHSSATLTSYSQFTLFIFRKSTKETNKSNVANAWNVPHWLAETIRGSVESFESP